MDAKKKGLLVCSGTAAVKNIGDYIQSVAQEQFLGHVDTYVEREELNSFQSDEGTKVIMNAWFMWSPENFPPSASIDPLFISMHIVPSIADRMLSPEAVKYLKKYEPIGARDTGTKELLEKHGISSYFSGCLTLALGYKYKSAVKDNSIYIVDPYYELGCCSSKNKTVKWLKAFWLLIKHYRAIKPIVNRFQQEFYSGMSRYSSKLDRLLHIASFYDSYSKMFSDEILYSAVYLKHEVRQSDFNYSNNEKMEYARSLVRKYAKARLVVTSRIHCALPCLGVETPVIFVTSSKLEEGRGRGGSNGRFGGLIELMHTMRWTSSGVEPLSEAMRSLVSNGKIDLRSRFKNSEDYKPICLDLIKRVKEFLNS